MIDICVGLLPLLAKCKLLFFCDVMCLDFSYLDAEIASLRKQLKPKVDKLRDLEHKNELRGFNLNPLSPQELDAIKTVLWYRQIKWGISYLRQCQSR